MIQNINFVLGLQCKKCDRFHPLSEKSSMITHRNGEISVKTNDFHTYICGCEVK